MGETPLSLGWLHMQKAPLRAGLFRGARFVYILQFLVHRPSIAKKPLQVLGSKLVVGPAKLAIHIDTIPFR